MDQDMAIARTAKEIRSTRAPRSRTALPAGVLAIVPAVLGAGSVFGAENTQTVAEVVRGVLAAPGPSSWALLLLGFLCLGFVAFRRGK